jgi:uncharacterized membrane protein
MVKISRSRHLAKAITWRIIGTLDTFLLGWFLSGSIEIGVLIGGAEVFTKTFLYFIHERIWYKYIKLGVINTRKTK